MEQLLKGPAFRRVSLRTLQGFLSRQNGVLAFWKGKLRDSGKRKGPKVSDEGSAESGEIPECLPICLEVPRNSMSSAVSAPLVDTHVSRTETQPHRVNPSALLHWGGTQRGPAHPIPGSINKMQVFYSHITEQGRKGLHRSKHIAI